MRVEEMTPEAALAALQWQVEMGVDEAILERPADRFEPAPAPGPAPSPQRAPDPSPTARPAQARPEDAAIRDAQGLAANAPDLPALHAALAGFEGCALKRGARSCVFADGHAGADLMLVGEAPGRDEDRLGKPFVGRSGQLLDRMLAAIGRDRAAEDPAKGAYITNMIPWRPLENRTPSDDEIAMMLPFIERHIALAQPKLLLFLGNTPTKALLRTTQGITRMRGQWGEWRGIPVMPSFHPAFLLRQALRKRESWRDLLAVKLKLESL